MEQDGVILGTGKYNYILQSVSINMWIKHVKLFPIVDIKHWKEIVVNLGLLIVFKNDRFSIRFSIVLNF